MNSLKNLFHVIFYSIVLVLGVSGASFRIHSLEIFTSDCNDCGVGVLGEVSVKVITKILLLSIICYVVNDSPKKLNKYFGLQLT